MVVFDLLGSPLAVGDCVVQCAGHGPCRSGRVTGFTAGADGFTRVLADGDFKRGLLPSRLLSVSALGVPTQPVEREEVFPDRPYEYNRERICDALGCEARAGDEVVYWRSGEAVAYGTIRHFCPGLVVLHPDTWPKNRTLSRAAGQFVICKRA